MEELKQRIINEKIQDRAEGELARKRAQDGLLLEKQRCDPDTTLHSIACNKISIQRQCLYNHCLARENLSHLSFAPPDMLLTWAPLYRAAERLQNEQRMHEETKLANEALKKIKALERQRELEEEEKMYEFARRKEQLVMERKVGFSFRISNVSVSHTFYFLL